MALQRERTPASSKQFVLLAGCGLTPSLAAVNLLVASVVPLTG